MTYRNYWEDDVDGREDFGPYETEEEARIGFFRLVVSAVVAFRGDGVRRIVGGDGFFEEVVAGSTLAAEHPEWTQDYKDRLYYEMRDDEVRAEYERWMEEDE